MPMPLVHDERAIEMGRFGPNHQLTRLGTQPHRTPLLRQLPLLVEHSDDWIRAIGIEFTRVSLLQLQNVARKFDRCHLHSEAEPEVRYAILPGVARGLDLTFDATFPKTTRHQDTPKA